jgi:hypothetical protein
VLLEAEAGLAPHLRGGEATESVNNFLIPEVKYKPVDEDRLLTEKDPQSIVGGTLATSRPWFVQGRAVVAP